MGFSNQERINMNAKALAAGVLDSNPNAQWYETVFPFGFILNGSSIWTEMDDVKALPAGSLAVAQANASANPSLIGDRTAAAVQLTAVPGTNNSTWAVYSVPGDTASPVIGNWIMPQHSIQANGLPSNGYSILLYNGDPAAGGAQITTTIGTTGTGDAKSVGWTFNYSTGMLLLSTDFFTLSGIPSVSFHPWIKGFTYEGNTANDGGTGSSGPSDFRVVESLMGRDILLQTDLANGGLVYVSEIAAFYRGSYDGGSITWTWFDWGRYVTTQRNGGSAFSLYVDSSAGDDDYYDGSALTPYASISRAIADVGIHNSAVITINIVGSVTLPRMLTALNNVSFRGTVSVTQTATISSIVSSTPNGGYAFDINGSYDYHPDELRGEKYRLAGNRYGWVYSNNSTSSGITRVFVVPGDVTFASPAIGATFEIIINDSTLNTPTTAVILSESIELNFYDLNTLGSRLIYSINGDKTIFERCKITNRSLVAGRSGAVWLNTSWVETSSDATNGALAVNFGELRLALGSVVDMSSAANKFVAITQGRLNVYGYNMIAHGTELSLRGGVSHEDGIIRSSYNAIRFHDMAYGVRINAAENSAGGGFSLPAIYGAVLASRFVIASNGAHVEINEYTECYTGTLLNAVSADNGLSSCSWYYDGTIIIGGEPSSLFPFPPETDIPLGSVTGVNGANDEPIAAMSFPSYVLGFEAIVVINLTRGGVSYRETQTLVGSQMSAGWAITSVSAGDYTGYVFDMDPTGILIYDSTNYGDFNSSSISYRAITLYE